MLAVGEPPAFDERDEMRYEMSISYLNEGAGDSIISWF
jgi:hypothetical protein